MRFLADMGISPSTVAFLRGLGYEALHLHEEGLDRLRNSAILTRAREEGWVILTHDLDFGELVAASGARLPSLVVFRLRNMHPDRVNQYLHRIVGEHQAALEQGAVISVTEGQIRVRPLPC